MGADGVSALRPLPLSVLVRRAAEELPTGSVYDLPARHVFRGFPGLDLSVRFHGHRCADAHRAGGRPAHAARAEHRALVPGRRAHPRAQDRSGERPARDPAPVHRHADGGLQRRVVAGAPRRGVPPRVREGAPPRRDPGRAVRHSRRGARRRPRRLRRLQPGRHPVAQDRRVLRRGPRRERAPRPGARGAATASCPPPCGASPTSLRGAPLRLGHALHVPRLSGRRDRRHQPAPPLGARPPHDRQAEPDAPRLRGGGGDPARPPRVHAHRPPPARRSSATCNGTTPSRSPASCPARPPGSVSTSA